MSNPEEIRRDIERTRAELSDNVNALGDSTSPGNIARGQVDKVKESAASLKERVFGAPEDPYDDGMMGDARSIAGDVSGKAAAMVADAGGAVSGAPQRVKSGTRGNPLAAGLIALGIGALVGGLIPSSRKEHEVAQQLKEASQPLVDEVRQMAMDVKDNLQPLAQEAAHAVGDVAKDAGAQVRQDAANARDMVVDQAKSSVDNVKGDAQDAVDQTKVEATSAAKEQKPDNDNAGGDDAPSSFYG